MAADSLSSKLGSSYLTVKLAMITGVGLLFLIASYWLNSNIKDREELLYKAKKDIVLGWAGPQTIVGPLLIVPYTKHHVKDKDETGYKFFFPNDLNVKGTANPEIRRRGIFDVLVYQAQVEISCRFLPLSKLPQSNLTFHWEQAKIAVCLDDVRGVNQVTCKLNGHDVPVLAGSAEVRRPGVHVSAALNENDILSVDLSINMKGSDSLSVLPIARDNKIELGANWPDPSFIGQFLPNTKNVNKQDFLAQWSISSLATSLPEYLDQSELTDETFSKALGVRFLKTADHYQQAERTTKYTFLFVLYTFLVFFLYEVIKQTKIHIFQYCITASSLLCFSLLLTAFAEHIPFELAYGVASLAIIGQISFYAFGILHKKTERLVWVSLLVGLYVYLFVVLRLEEFSLLIGALGMFTAITVAMALTKKLKWF